MTALDSVTRRAIALAGVFILVLSVADIAATKFVTVGSVVMPAGTFLFAIIFVVRDMLHKTVGAAAVRYVIKVAIATNVAVGLYLFAMTKLPAPGFRPSDAFDSLFALAPGIVVGSIVAAFASQYVNTWAYQALWDRNVGQLGRTVASNVLSLPVDAVLFTIIGFVLVPPLIGATGIPMDAAVARIASGQTLFKAAVMLAATPLVYLIPTAQGAREAK